jgi:Peptidase family M28
VSRTLLAPALLLVVVHLGSAQTPVHATAKPSAAAVKPVWPDEGPLKWAPRPTVPDITANDLRTRLYQFADDSMMGRRIGELGNFKGTTYIASEFKRLGLKPGGDNGTYFQILDYGTSAFDTTSVSMQVVGAALTQHRDFMPTAPTAANGAAARVNLPNTPTIFAGRAGDSSVTLDPAVFRGKVAVFLPALPVNNGGGSGRGNGPIPVCSADQGWPNQRGASYALQATATAARGGAAGGGRGGARGGRDQRAMNAGVAAVLVVADVLPGGGNFTTARGMFPVVGPNAVPTASISADAALKIFGKPVAELTVGTVGQPISASWNYLSTLSPTPARNVIGILPGSDPARATEYVLVSAHNDHNGVNAIAVDHDSLRAYNTIMRPQGANDGNVCRPNERQQFLIDSLIRYARSIRPPRRDSIMNGADDDGSGTVVLLEIAEKFVTEHPARSIIFVSHTGEEAGLLGSAWFTSHPTIPLDSVVAAHNMDMLGKGRVTDVAMGGPASVQTLGSRRLAYAFGDIIDSVNAISKEPMSIDKTWDIPANPLNRFCRSDQVNYVNHNVPVTYFSLGYARDYHQPTDEPQYIDYDHAARLARFIHDVMMAVANRGDRPKIDGPDLTMPTCGR